ncbi:glycosyltransferase family 2 protein [Sneathiella sp.]|uniref:glycosyltransferase family 2 protein n=1 Tax=Sneathiella sp. TaxID=1964365 RepID=UPI0030037EC7
MPVFNGEVFIGSAIQSLLDQDHKDLEILISDNASTDATISIIESFSDPRITVIKQKSNVGALENFRLLSALSTANFFLWRSYDDRSDSNYISVLLDILLCNEGCSLAVSKIVRKRMDGSIAGEIDYPAALNTRSAFFVKDQLSKSHPGWFYGLYRRANLPDRIQDVVTRYTHVWAWDHLVLFNYVVRGEVMGTNETKFYQLETGKSDSRWRPKDFRGQYDMAVSFMKYCVSIVKNATLSRGQKIIIYAYLPSYVNGTTAKFRRIIRSWLKEKLASS